MPAVQQTALGDFCESGLKVPSTWAGSKGVIGIVQDAADGLLYQVSLSLLSSVIRLLTMSATVLGRQFRRRFKHAWWYV